MSELQIRFDEDESLLSSLRVSGLPGGQRGAYPMKARIAVSAITAERLPPV